MDRARTHQKEELQWVLDIVRGIQLLSEGAHRNNQDWLREQGTRGQSVNFVVEICRALGLIYMNIGQVSPIAIRSWTVASSNASLCCGRRAKNGSAFSGWS